MPVTEQLLNTEVFRRELVRRVGNEKRRFTDGRIAHNNTFYGLHPGYILVMFWLHPG
jgi:hypothetical protein